MGIQRFAYIAMVAALALASLSQVSCGRGEPPAAGGEAPPAFDPASLEVPDQGGRKLRAQVLYMPVYSSIPYKSGSYYDLSAFLAIHNTDLQLPLSIRRVDFFDSEGRMLESFVSGTKILGPMATAIFPVSKKGQKGAGANFLVEWTADSPVNEPLVESVMKDLGSNLGISFLSQGRIIRELR